MEKIMDKNYKQMTQFLVDMGIEKVPHTSKTYLGHLIAVHRLMESESCTEEACRAGMFHSVYGTERFQGFKLPLERRNEVRDIIGERAERLAYLNCAMDRTSFDQAVARNIAPYRFRDRITGEEVVLSQQDCDDLCGCISTTFWSRSRASANGNIAGPAIGKWRNVWAAQPSTPTSASTPRSKWKRRASE